MLGVAQYYSPMLSDANPADGYLGMGFRNLSNFDANPVFQTLVAQHALTEPVFSFNFAKPHPELFLGGIDRNMYQPPLTYVPVTRQVSVPARSIFLDLTLLGGSRVSGKSRWMP